MKQVIPLNPVIIENANEAIQRLIEILPEIFEKIYQQTEEIAIRFTEYCMFYDKRKVVLLAFYAKKKRVRKKNYNRIMNDYLKHISS